MCKVKKLNKKWKAKVNGKLAFTNNKQCQNCVDIISPCFAIHRRKKLKKERISEQQHHNKTSKNHPHDTKRWQQKKKSSRADFNGKECKIKMAFETATLN